MARLIAYAVADERIGGVMRKSEYEFTPTKRNVHVNSTNRLIRNGTGDLEVLGGKTGYISSSGYCLATVMRLPQSGRQVAVVVLGAKSNAARFAETRHLVSWVSGPTMVTATADVVATQQQQQ
jgi:D-alanyl-D-alanine carboxypeptidase